MAECCVCYDDMCTGRCTTMKCGHRMHTKCIKTWYLKNENPTCPMCRGPFRFKGCIKALDSWDSEREDFEDEVFDNHLEDLFQYMEDEPWAMNFWLGAIEQDQILYNVLKGFEWDPDWIQDYLEDEHSTWISPRRLNKKNWPGRKRDPIKVKPPKHFAPVRRQRIF